MTAAHSAEADETRALSQEPSMDDILASIRRIIAEDQALFAAADAAGESFVEQEGFVGETDGPAADAEAPLASPGAAASVGDAFNALVAARFAENSDVILAMTRDALRPLVAAWLDEHLPPLVERLVRAEIERLAAPRGVRG